MSNKTEILNLTLILIVTVFQGQIQGFKSDHLFLTPEKERAESGTFN